jgi:hypothetical protein
MSRLLLLPVFGFFVALLLLERLTPFNIWLAIGIIGFLLWNCSAITYTQRTPKILLGFRVRSAESGGRTRSTFMRFSMQLSRAIQDACSTWVPIRHGYNMGRKNNHGHQSTCVGEAGDAPSFRSG